LKHSAVDSFWASYEQLPDRVKRLADKNYELLRINPKHPSLRFKELKADLWSVRIGTHYRALAYSDEHGFTWFWIGAHAEYDKLIK
jgi:hypothetical protein